jgi:dolichyl-phosphate-mannose--protein O-mannosyl transferase
MIGRIARRLFHSTLLGTTAAILLAVDGQHFVHSRTGLLDVFVMFWALAAFGCILIDRDQARARLAVRHAALDRARDPGRGGANDRFLTRFGPGLGIRWWRVAAGVCLGLCTGTKWSGLFFAAAFGTASVLWDVAARRASGSRHWLVTGLVRDGASGLLHIVPVAFTVYLASWTGWFQSTDGYNRHWADTHPPTGLARLVPDAVRSLADYHRQMWGFNTTLHTPHDYQSHPFAWLVLGRPTAFDYRSYKQGENGCTVSECAAAVVDLGNPVIWWGGTIAIAVLVVVWLLGRDWRAGAVLAGLAGGYLPWFVFAERTIYTFYAVAFVPYVVLALTLVLGLVLGRPDARPDRRLTGAACAGAVVLLAVVTFAWFYPVLSDTLIPHSSWVDRMWLPSWI